MCWASSTAVLSKIGLCLFFPLSGTDDLWLGRVGALRNFTLLFVSRPGGVGVDAV